MGLIVVVEDNEHSARMAAKLLRRFGHEVLIAEDGETGLQTVFDNKPDLILLDLGLPDIDGQTVIGIARQQPHLASKPIIAFTAWPAERAAEMAKNYGCDGVITKPINTRTFANQVNEFLPVTSNLNTAKVEAKIKLESEKAEKVEVKADPVAEDVEKVETKADPVAEDVEKIEAKADPASEKAEKVEVKADPASEKVETTTDPQPVVEAKKSQQEPNIVE